MVSKDDTQLKRKALFSYILNTLKHCIYHLILNTKAGEFLGKKK